MLSILSVGLAIAIFSEELNKLLNGNELIILMWISTFVLFSIYISFYNIAKYSKINTKYVIGLLLISILLMFVDRIISNYFLHSNFITFLLKSFMILFVLLFFFSFQYAILIFLRWREPSPLKRYFINAQSKLDGLLKDSQESLIHKNLSDLFYIFDNYNDGTKEINNSFGKVTYFNNINIININTKKSITEILDNLTFSMPYYIFYGEIEQIKEMGTHIENVNKCLKDVYSIAGGPFVIEILRMNDKVDKYFKENSFEFSKYEYAQNGKYEYYIKKVFLFALTLVSSIVLYKLGPLGVAQ